MVELKEANQNLEEQILKEKVEETIKGMQENLHLQECPSAIETQEIRAVTETLVSPIDISPLLTGLTKEPLPMEVSETPVASVASQSLSIWGIADDKCIEEVNASSPPISVPQTLATNVVIQDFKTGRGRSWA